MKKEYVIPMGIIRTVCSCLKQRNASGQKIQQAYEGIAYYNLAQVQSNQKDSFFFVKRNG